MYIYIYREREITYLPREPQCCSTILDRVAQREDRDLGGRDADDEARADGELHEAVVRLGEGVELGGRRRRQRSLPDIPVLAARLE